MSLVLRRKAFNLTVFSRTFLPLTYNITNRRFSYFNKNISNNINTLLHSKYSLFGINNYLFCSKSDNNSNNSSDIHEAEIVDENKDEKVEIQATMDEEISGETKEHLFQTETKQLLDIVSNSLYTEKEVFLRELLSNSSDALEKMRYLQTQNPDNIIDRDVELSIDVYTDMDKGLLIIQDTGVGMNEKELRENLGVIARSGSKAFVRQLAEQNEKLKESGVAKLKDTSLNDSIIGQFGVGFYSVFMVASKVEVYSHGYSGDDEGFYWCSDGSGKYDLAKAKNVKRGTKIIVNLKENYIKEFSDRHRIEEIIKKYSSYLLFPIRLNGSLITSTGAIWSKGPKSVKKDEHKEFYQLISNRYDDPYYIYHTHFESSTFSAQCLIYFPEQHEEKFGAGRLEPGIHLYCKKVLVKKNAKEIIPDWLRFCKGVVDSENIPIHISRENMQDSQLIKQLQETLMMKIVDFLKRQSTSDNDKYIKWYNDYGPFLKEGVCTDYKNRSRIAKLLRYETNKTEKGKKISLDDYIDNMKKDTIDNDKENKDDKKQESQKEIYYLLAPNREAALKSPYIEAFNDNDIEVLLCYAQIDEFVMKNLGSYRSKEIVGIEASTNVKSKDEDNIDALSEEDSKRLSKWLKKHFNDSLEKVEITMRLKNHPAVLVDHQSQALRFYLKQLGEDVKVPPQRMQINPKHNIIKGLYKEIDNNELKAKMIAKQLINNAFIAAGIWDDPRDILQDIYYCMELGLGYDTNQISTKHDKDILHKIDPQLQNLQEQLKTGIDEMEQMKKDGTFDELNKQMQGDENVNQKDEKDKKDL